VTRTASVLPTGYLFSQARPNSIETVVRTLARANRRDDLMIFADAGAEDVGDLPVTRIPAQGSRSGRLAALITALRAWTPELIEAHQHVPTGSRLARAFKDTPVALYRHNMTPPPRGWLSRWRYHHRLDPIAAHVFVSQTARQDFQTDYPAFAARAHAVPNPVDAAPWRADPADREPLIVFAGRATQEKGLGLLCEALPRVLCSRPGWRAELLLADWRMHRAWAEGPLQALAPVSDRVTVTTDAPLARVRDALQRAAIVTVPSIWKEPFGLAALEAHAAGAAVISSGTGGLREASGDHALYVEPLTADSLTDALLLLIDQPERRLALARAGQDFVAETHGPDRRAEQLSTLRAAIVQKSG
jgi:glycosyltransferase involved in cell wall biosynthesis